ncbi:ABC-type dipeptide oligopeptide nickel transport system, ATPase component [Liquorilactobacillus mali]|uniref:ABC-type dipeptide oligopeptide nickel transport system, ATPase component n=1 Tax=Liquorilactobacillus mali TaxID=1618 RepID=A0A0R2FKW6_9LACO|nr:ABC-type dipeptide oligopeptide nickel transport system, ATPase component [Liquorilactobacillus mali]
MPDSRILDIKDLNVSFNVSGNYYKAVSGVNLEVNTNEILAIVGESGCGKSTLATTIMGLHDNSVKIGGSVIFENKNLLSLKEDEFNKIRGAKIGMIFQDPLSALNPLKKIKEAVT